MRLTNLLTIPTVNFTDPKFLNKLKIMLKSALDDVEVSIRIEYNIEAYKALITLERFLRDMIQEKNNFEKIDNKKIRKIWGKCKKRMKKESKIKLCENNGYGLIEYSDFKDLRTIFEYSRDLFQDLIQEDDSLAVITKIHELEPIRNKIAHSRLITKKELTRIKLYQEDILKLLSN